MFATCKTNKPADNLVDVIFLQEKCEVKKSVWLHTVSLFLCWVAVAMGNTSTFHGPITSWLKEKQELKYVYFDK